MYMLKPLYIIASFFLLLCILTDAVPTRHAGSTALEIRPRGDLETFHVNPGNSLMSRATPIELSMAAIPIMGLGYLTMITCRDPILNLAACYTVWSLTLAASISYLGQVFYYAWAKNGIDTKNNMITTANQAETSTRDLDDYNRKLQVQRSKDSFELWKNRETMRRRTWEDTWKPRFKIYKELASDNPKLEDYITKADKALSKAIKAEEAYIEAELNSVSLKEILDGEDGTVSIAELRELEKEAEEAITTLKNQLKLIINSDVKHLEAFAEMAFGNKDSNPLLESHVSRRALEAAMLPRLVSEINTNCDNQHCHRLWYSLSVSGTNRKRGITPSDFIYNIYSTPVDYEFDHDRVLRRRDDPAPTTWTDEDYECEEIEEVEVVGKPVLFRMAGKPGNDTQSLKQFGSPNTTAEVTTLKTMLKNSLMKNSNMTIWGSGEWQCINADTDNGGEPAVRAVAIFTEDEEKLDEDVEPLFKECESRLPDL